MKRLYQNIFVLTRTTTLLYQQSMARRLARHTAHSAGRYVVAIMNEALELMPGLLVLEVGAGSGYHAATIAEQIAPGGSVCTIELVMELVELLGRTWRRRATPATLP